uniref:radical SAM/SPASM domain-containing protein n=1 Tax=Cellvibrio fontiphilus TaxID=1815559 RepID=UPI002B4BF14D|nr:radical SAM protein [Cellvibrio fontiphilus]
MNNQLNIDLAGLTKKESLFLSQMCDSKFFERLKLESMKPHEILDKNEIEIFEGLLKSRINLKKSHFKKHSFLILKATRICNLRCTYCHSWREGKGNVMPFEILAKTISDILSAEDVKRVDFIWHGGEVTLLDTRYIKKALWLQSQFKKANQLVTNSIQTNATNLTEDWLNLLKTFDFEVGVSIDGPQEIHDKFRLTKNNIGTFNSVKEGIEKLRVHQIPFGALAVVNEYTLAYGARKYLEFLISLDLKGVALLNAIPKEYKPKAGETYLPWDYFVEFLHEIFIIWWNEFRETISIRELNGLVENTKNKKPIVCEFAGDCMGQFLTIEPNGTVSACDKYVGDTSHQFGNISYDSLPNIIEKSVNLDIAVKKAKTGISQMSECEFFHICKGGCPHDVQLNMQNSEGWNGKCCGMRALMSEIKTAVKRYEINYVNL